MICKNHSIVLGFVWIFVGATCGFAAPAPDSPIRVLIFRNPSTLNPRSALEETGQELGSLLFGALTQLDSNLKTVPDQAESWKPLQDGKGWSFKIKSALKDHHGFLISAPAWRECLENYRVGQPPSPVKSAIPFWEGTESTGSELRILTREPVPDLPSALTQFRFFRQEGKPPCSEVDPKLPVITSGLYTVEKLTEPWDLSPLKELKLKPLDPTHWSALHFIFIRDENTRALAFIRGDADVAWNAFSADKYAWLARSYGDRFVALERPGVKVDYLAFNLKDPLLANPKVRQAIALAIDKKAIIEGRYRGYCLTAAASLLSPFFEESLETPVNFDRQAAEKLLEEAGFPRQKNGNRFSLRYKCTSNSVGRDKALLIKDALQAVGIEVKIDVVEPAVFTASIQKGNFQLFSSRWIKIDGPGILFTSLYSSERKNYPRYQSEKVDRLLLEARGEMKPAIRRNIYREIQKEMAADLPYFPLWFWNNDLLLTKDLTGIKAQDLSPYGGYLPLGRIRRKP